MSGVTGHPLNIVWNSVAPWVPSGYGQQTAQVCRRLRDAGHNVAISAFVGIEGHMSEWEGINVYPTDHTRFNKYALPKYVRHHSPDGTGDDVLVITLQDVWTWNDVSHQSGGMRAAYDGLNIAAWVPIHHDPMPPNTIMALRDFNARPIAMCRFAEDRMKREGFGALYVPHAVDTNVLRPRPAASVRRDLMQVPDDAFLIGMVSHNQGVAPARKAFPEVFAAFSIFVRRHPEAILYLHTDAHGFSQGLNLIRMLEQMNIRAENVRFVDQDSYGTFCNIETEHMSFIYSAMDVLACPSYAEGFGIPIVEAQACGTPVIATDFTSMPELIGPGWLVDGEPYRDAGAASWWMKPSITEILGAFEQAYEARGDEKLSAACREFALGYDADKVFAEHWVPTLDALSRPHEVPPLPALNREQRQAKIKARGKVAA